MVPPKVNENSSMDVAKIFSILENADCSLKDKRLAYSSLTRYLTEEDGLKNPYIQQRRDCLLKFLLQDSSIQNSDIIKSLLKVLHYYITEHSTRAVTKESPVFQVLLRTLKGEHSDEVNNEILNCLAFQKFQPAVLIADLPVLLERLEDMFGRKKAHSDQFIERLVDSIFRLEEQMGQKISSDAPRIILLIVQGLIHPLQDTRMRSLELVTKFKPQLMGNLDFAKQLVKTINSDFSKNLKSMLTKDCQHITTVWSMLLDLMGKVIHKGPSINIMLQVVEPAFKGQADSRMFAFKAWKSLIDNFALDPDVISEPKRIRLLMMVMKIDNAKTEPVALAKLTTWWHLVCCVSAKLSANFEQIIYPLLQLCTGNNKLHSASSQHGTSPFISLSMSPGKNGPTRGVNHSFQVFPTLQKAGCEIVGHIVSKSFRGDAPLAVSWTLDPLPVDVLSSPSTFVKHAPFLMTAACELFKSLGSEIEDSLVLHIWRSLSNHLRCAMESVKMESRDTFSAFLSHLRILIQGSVFKEPLLFKMLLSSCNFTQKVLASTAFNIGGGNVRGCPALFLTEIMFTPVIVKHSSTSEQFIKLFSTLVNAGVSNIQGALAFLQAVMDLVDSRVHDLPTSDFLWRLWSTVAHTLHEHINSTNEVNQGDALEYNFGCLYATLLLPIRKQMLSKVSQAVGKTILRTWRELYHTFARLSALVATAEANTCLEELSSKILQSWQLEFKDPSSLEFISNVCQKMLDSIDFSALAVSQTPGSGLTLSPSRWAKRRSRPMANLHSYIHLIAKIQTEINDLLAQLGERKIDLKQNNVTASINVSVNAMVDICSHLFSHITSALVPHVIATLCPPLSCLYSSKTRTGSVKVFVPSFMAKLERLWQEIVNCVTGRYNDQYDSDFLALLAPMLEETFVHPRRGIKSQTLTLWSSTFSKSHSLVYPESLKCVLCKVKEKTALVLPGWIVSPEQVIEETPYSEISQISQGDSQVPTPVLPGLPSPKRLTKGSFITRDISPARPTSANKVSPAKVISPKDVKSLFSSSRKNISMDLNMMPAEEFVVIASPPKPKRRLLTEHQKEVLREKSAIPALYNNLDASMDKSLTSFDTQESLSSMDVVTKTDGEELKKKNVHGSSSVLSFKNTVTETCNSAGFIVPKGPMPTRRRSSRISEKSSENTQDKTDLDASNESNVSNPPKVNARKQSTESLMDIKSKDVPKPGPKAMQVTEPNGKEKGSETEPAAFKMFRTRSQAAESNASKTVEEPGPAAFGTQPRRVSLRKIHSHEIAPSTDESATDSSNADKGKSPRRVPLRRLNEQKSSPEEDKNASATVLDNTDSKSKPQDTKSIQISEKSDPVTSNSNKTLKSSLDNWLLNGKKTTDNTQAVSKTTKVNPPSAKSTQQENKTESFTLVEDTQSPSKLNQDKNEGSSRGHESIAETPTKSDDATSPSPRVTKSVRKLFSEKNEQASDSAVLKSCAENSHPSSDLKVDTHPVAKDSVQDSNIALFDSDPIISSQGFHVPSEIPKESKKDVTETTITPEETKLMEVESENLEADNAKNGKDFPESEILLDSPMQTTSSSELMSMMQMPTLTSQQDKAISKSTESSCSTKTSSSDESCKKSTPSSESDFDPSQSTLKDDGSDKPPVKGDKCLSSRLRFQTQSEKQCSSPEKETEGQDKAKVHESPITKPFDESPDDEVCNKEEEEESKKPEVEPFTKIDEKSVSEPESNKEKKATVDVTVVGEVTPDVKSPSESSPIRRSSTNKNRRRAAKRLSEHLNEDLCSEISGASDFSSTSSKDSAAEKSTSRRQKRNKLIETLSPSSLQRKSSVPSPQSLKSKHILRTRTKVVRRLPASPPALSPPTRRRRLKRKQRENSDNEDTDDQPLSRIKKRKVTEKLDNHDGSVSDDDKPLSSFINNKNQTLDENVSANVTEVQTDPQKSEMSPIEEKDQEEKLANANPDELPEKSNEVEIVVECMDVQVPEAESVEVESQSLLVQATQVTADSPDDKKIEITVESSQESTGSDEVFQSEKFSRSNTSSNEGDPVGENDVPKPIKEVTVVTEKTEEVEKENETSKEVAVVEIPETEEDVTETPVKERVDSERDDQPYTPSQWSPSKSPSCSILKKPTPTSEKQSRRVSFAEPVVSGESPVREKYHCESLPTSPLICHSGQATKFSRPSSSPSKLIHRGTPYRRRLEGSLRKNENHLVRHRNSPSHSSTQSQNSYRPTQESQLDAVNPIFPDLVDCKAPLDCILPQLTSSLWHRGLCQLMKGRNLHTIGDISSLTEVQVNQMPIRHPKVQTVRDTLMTYLNQHGNSKGSKSIFACSAIPLEPDTCISPKSTGATLEQAVTPSNIADEGMKILPRVEEDLSELSPIIDESAKGDEDNSQLAALSKTTTMSDANKDETQDKVILALSDFVSASQTGLKDVSLTNLFDIHHKLNTLMGSVVDEMKARQTTSRKSGK